MYERLNNKKQNGLISGVAIQRKLLVLIFSLWKNDSEYIENYELKKQAKLMMVSGNKEPKLSFCEYQFIRK
ncbi:hypothetical protein DMA11_22775 [Marinilabiliaceae bacterium JC017]|nr:hypothetical protein DMA11_22775 [Marinilabiliaceae bacterium JC017]